MILSSKKDLSKSVLNIKGVELSMESSVKLLGIETDNQYLSKSQQPTKFNLQTASIYGS